MQEHTTRRRRQRGFSLLEILVVVAIMSLLAAVAVPKVMSLWSGARRDTAMSTAQNYRSATNIWRLRAQGDECPTPAKLLQEQVIDKGASTTDPWGNPFQISCDDGGVTVSSAGPDRRSGTADDIIAPPETRSASR